MPNILHRLTIDAPPERVHQLAATREGIQQWWTGHPVAGDDKTGEEIAVYFSDPADAAAAVFEVIERSPERIVWRCVDGPDDWIDTRITFALKPRTDGGTTLRGGHRHLLKQGVDPNGVGMRRHTVQHECDHSPRLSSSPRARLGCNSEVRIAGESANPG